MRLYGSDMTNMQRSLSGRYKGGMVAILVSYVLMLHVLLGSYAQAAVLGDGSASPLFVLCDPHGVVANQQGESDAKSSSELSNLLCKSACALGTALSNAPLGVMAAAGDPVRPRYDEPLQQATGLFVLSYARAPPLL